MLVVYEPAHDKTYNKTCETSEQISLRIHRIFADRMCLLQTGGCSKRDKREPLLYRADVQADLSLLVAQVLLVLSCSGSYMTILDLRLGRCHVDTISSSPISEPGQYLDGWPPGNIVAMDLFLFSFLFFFKPNCSWSCIPEISRYPFFIPSIPKVDKRNNIWPRGYKTFFMLNLDEHEIFSANKSQLTTTAKHTCASCIP